MASPGRIEVYIHSDSSVENKGACVVRIYCEFEAASKTDEFKMFCKRIAMFGYSCGEGSDEETVFDNFPELQEEREKLSELLKEEIKVDDLCIFNL